MGKRDQGGEGLQLGLFDERRVVDREGPRSRFNAEASYAESIFRSSLGDSDACVSALHRSHEAYADGLDLYRQAVSRFPDVPVLHQGRGCCAGHQELHDEAIEASKAALALEPDNQTYVNDLGWSLFRAGRIDEAKATLERATAMDHTDIRARNNLSLCKEALERRATEG